MPAKNELFAVDDGNTPLDDDAIAGLIPPDIRTRGELNAWEATNIGRALAWAYGRAHLDILSVETLQEIHRRMFDATWRWAGTFRRSENHISKYPWPQVPMLMRDLVENTRAQHVASEKIAVTLDDVALRFHHHLVQIHPWPNGNGRHARLATDLMLREWRRPPFTWGGAANAIASEETRDCYIRALRSADAGNLEVLRNFVRS